MKPETRHPLFILPKALKAICLAAIPMMLALALTQNTPVAAQGYQGLIPDNRAPAKNQRNTAPPPTEQGYQGLISPARPEKPRGYEGVVPGETPERAPAFTAVPSPDKAAPQTQVAAPSVTAPPMADATRPEEQRVAAMTPRPGAIPFRPIRTAEDLEALARLHGMKLELPKLSDEIAARIKISPKSYSIVSSPRIRIEGMLPPEAMIKKQIEQVMFSVNMPNITKEQRRRNARAGYERLLKFADTFTYKANLPDSLYEKMGLPAIFVQEQKEANTKVLMRLDEAFRVLKPLQ